MKIITNPDKEFAQEIKKQLKENGGHCPCALERSPDTKCMCKEFREAVRNGEPGSCHCGLYIAEDGENGKTNSFIL